MDKEKEVIQDYHSLKLVYSHLDKRQYFMGNRYFIVNKAAVARCEVLPGKVLAVEVRIPYKGILHVPKGRIVGFYEFMKTV